MKTKICEILLQISFTVFIWAAKLNKNLAIGALDNLHEATFTKGEQKSD